MLRGEWFPACCSLMLGGTALYLNGSFDFLDWPLWAEAV